MQTTIPHDAPIYVAGHNGLVGSAIVRRLESDGHRNLLLATRQELDLRDQSAVDAWFAEKRPAFVFLVAGTVGGVLENLTYPAEFLYDNLLIHCHGRPCRRTFPGVQKLLYLGSSCIYPSACVLSPFAEEELLSGPARTDQ